MRKITALTAFLKAVTGLPGEQVHAFADMGEINPCARNLGVIWSEDGQSQREHVEIAVWTYDAVLQLERYAGDGSTLLALIMAWLMDNDPTRDHDALGDPVVDVEINDLSTSDVGVSVKFEERLTIIEDAEGDIPYRGKRWRLTPPEVAPVEKLGGLRRA